MISLFPSQAGLARFVRPLAFGALGFSAVLAAADPVAPVAKAADTPPTFEGHVLVTPLKSKETVLVDGKGKEVHVWASAYEAAAGARLLPDGSILRMAVEKPAKTFRTTGLQGGRVQRIGWNGEVLWDFWNAATYHMAVGDALTLPNGNVLMLVAEYKSQEDVIALGRDRDRVTFEGLYAPGLMEFEPKGDKGGRLVWRWSAWDHVSQDRHPDKPEYDANRKDWRRLDINAGMALRGLVATELAYDSTSQLILLTLPGLGESWLLDHSANGGLERGSSGGNHGIGGRILWRWNAEGEAAGKQALRVLSADFAAPQTNGAPAVVFLAGSGSVSGNDNPQIQRVVPEITEGLGGLRGQGKVQTLSLKGRSGFGGQEQWNAISTASGFQLLGSRWTGSMELSRAEKQGGQTWQYQNTRGMASVRVSLDSQLVQECCGNPAVPANSAAVSAQTFRGAVIGRPRAYPKDYLQTAQDGTKLPKP